jgi:hypothetical protein
VRKAHADWIECLEGCDRSAFWSSWTAMRCRREARRCELRQSPDGFLMSVLRLWGADADTFVSQAKASGRVQHLVSRWGASGSGSVPT